MNLKSYKEVNIVDILFEFRSVKNENVNKKKIKFEKLWNLADAFLFHSTQNVKFLFKK